MARNSQACHNRRGYPGEAAAGNRGGRESVLDPQAQEVKLHWSSVSRRCGAPPRGIPANAGRTATWDLNKTAHLIDIVITVDFNIPVL